VIAPDHRMECGLRTTTTIRLNIPANMAPPLTKFFGSI
jgi:hypothetical protein